MAATSADLFKMVNLRGPDEDISFDPSQDPEVEVRLLRDTSFNELSSNEGPKIVRAATANRRPLSATKLRANYRWDSVLSAMKSGETTSSEISFGNGEISIENFSSTPEFRILYDDLYNSWLLIVLRGRYVNQKPPAMLERHINLLKAAHLISASGRGRVSGAQAAALLDAVIVLPRRWNRPTKKRGSSDLRTVVHEMRLELAQHKENHKRLVDDIFAIEALQLGASILVSELEREGKPTTNPPTRANIEKIAKKAPGVTTSIANTVIGSLDSVALNDLPVVLDHEIGRATTDANNLCESMQLFDEAIREKLPPAGAVSADERPSVRSIGWGDLIVARSNVSGYTASEIAHIENVLPGENKIREHERSTSTEEVTETESETETVSERDLETSDRFEIETQMSETLEKDFSIEAGVNTSGKYGVTKVETSLDAKYASSSSESFENAIRNAKEVVSKSLERTRTKVRELRRRTTVESIRELATHSIDNTIGGVGTNPKAESGVYYWVDKMERVQLRHYGKRVMIEFYVPEPGVSLIESKQSEVPEIRKPKPLAVGPGDINFGNYQCLTKVYGATGVQAPPIYQIQAGIGFATNVKGSSDAKDAESTVEGKIKVPPGYVPYVGEFSMAGRGTTNANNADHFNGHIAIAGQTVLDLTKEELEASYTGSFSLKRMGEVDDLGLPVTGRWSGHDDQTGTLNVNVWCVRNRHLLEQWQIGVYERLREAHQQLVEDYEADIQRQEFVEEAAFEVGGSPSAVSREIERNELKKWSIKTMRVEHFDFDAIVGAGEDEDALQEIDAAEADKVTPTVRFFENAFEWRHMSFFLYPYFWGRRKAWSLRQRITVPSDIKHELFLKSGYARVVVPVTPGFEARVLRYLDSNPNADEIDRIPSDESMNVDSPASAESLWEELRSDRDAETARGNGRLLLQTGSTSVAIEDNAWTVSQIDLGREIFIAGAQYEIIAIDPANNQFTLDRNFEGPDDAPQRFLVGSTPYGQSWSVTVPTRLTVLEENIDKL